MEPSHLDTNTWSFQFRSLPSVAILLLVLALGCYSDSPQIQKFTIPKGSHYATPRLIEYLETNDLHFLALLDSSAIYNVGEDDINKLYGFTDCNSPIHVNSARLGWRWSNQLELFAYVYHAGIRDWALLGTYPLGQWITCRISIEGDGYRLCVGDCCVVLPREPRCDIGIHLMSYPYFGGTSVASHDITILIKR